MRPISLLLSLSLLALAGCASNKASNDIVPGDYYWHLTHLNERPATPVEARTVLLFTNNQIHVSGLCNSMGGSALFNGKQLTISQLHSTMKACTDNELMAHERAFSLWLPEVNSWAITEHEQDLQLTLSQASGNFIQLRGEPTPEKRYGSSGEILFLEIQPKKVACNHPLIPDFQCLQTRYITYNEQGLKTLQGEWQNFYDEIQGYQHNENTRVILRVKRYKIANPPADASGFAYIHDLTVEQSLVSP